MVAVRRGFALRAGSSAACLALLLACSGGSSKPGTSAAPGASGGAPFSSAGASGVAAGSGGSYLSGTGGAALPPSGSAGAAGTNAVGGTGGSGPNAGASGANSGAAGGVGAGGMDAAGAGGGAGARNAPPPVPAGGTRLFPLPDASDVCPDPPLRASFSGPPALGASGKVQVFDAATGTPVASADLGASSVRATIGGTMFTLERPAYVDGNDAVVYLPPHALAYGKTYYVTVDAGAITGPTTTPFMQQGQNAWRFTTRAAPPADLGALVVAFDGTGDFCSVRGALDALPAKNSAQVRITLRAGTYHEIVHVSGKNNVTLHGDDRKASIISGTNNNNLNPSTATRSLFGVDSSSGFVVENLTIHNLTPQGGSQAEALRLQTCDQCVVRDADILSLQDTLLFSGRIYVKNSYIEGNVDYVWGTGTAFFDQCELKTVVRAGFEVQARNPASGYGYVFVGSKLTADPGIAGHSLARIDVSAYPGSHVAYIDCELGSHIAPAGFTITGGAPTPSLRFWEYHSKDPSGNPIDVSQRVYGSTQIADDVAAMMRDPKNVLGGWQPPP